MTQLQKASAKPRTYTQQFPWIMLGLLSISLAPTAFAGGTGDGSLGLTKESTPVVGAICSLDCTSIEAALNAARADEAVKNAAALAAESAMNTASDALDALIDSGDLTKAENAMASFIHAFMATHSKGQFSASPTAGYNSYMPVGGSPLYFDKSELPTILAMLDTAAIGILKDAIDNAREALAKADKAYLDAQADFGAARDAAEAAHDEVLRLEAALNDCLKCLTETLPPPIPIDEKNPPPSDGVGDEVEEVPEPEIETVPPKTECKDGETKEVAAGKIRTRNRVLKGVEWMRMVDYQGTHGHSNTERQDLMNGFANWMNVVLIGGGVISDLAGFFGNGLNLTTAAYGVNLGLSTANDRQGTDVVSNAMGMGNTIINKLRVQINGVFQTTVVGGRLSSMTFDYQPWSRSFVETKQRFDLYLCEEGHWVKKKKVTKVQNTWGPCDIPPQETITLNFSPFDLQPTSLGGQISYGVREFRADLGITAFGVCE
jgi:hypothetical protein